MWSAAAFAVIAIAVMSVGLSAAKTEVRKELCIVEATDADGIVVVAR